MPIFRVPFGLAAAVLMSAASAGAADIAAGQKLYVAKCADCHGPAGEGSKKYKKVLAGDRSPAQLADVIAKTMPESNPGSLSAAQSLDIATYIHGAFYSPTARERNRPARIELARLTVNQYRNAIADLIAGFRGTAKWGDERGLKGEYFKGRGFNGKERVLERVDPEVAFDFGVESPLPGKIDPPEFSLRWKGYVQPIETGEYEIIVRTEHAARLWLNDINRPLLDAWVKSGNDTEYKVTAFLLASRIYRLQLDYTKAKQGVDDSKKQKMPPKPVKSSIALLWKPPGRAVEPIPARLLSASSAPAPQVFVPTTAFPPDDRSYGWERGTTVSKEWDQATTDAAIETAGYITARLNEFAGTKDGAADRTDKLRDFCRKFAERAFRRPLPDAEANAMLDRQFSAAKDPDIAVKRLLLLVLKSPRFLYREVGGGPDAFDTAARLSFGLWDSIPDQELTKAAAEGRLATREQIAKQAERMLADPRAKAKLRGFLITWLKADHGLDLAKDAKVYPGFDPSVIADLRSSLDMFLDDVVWSESSDFRRFFTDEQLFLNPRLAAFYGAKLPAETGWHKVKMDGRAGVLSHPYLMASFAHSNEGSPIHRGVFLARGILGISLRPPPEAVAPLAPSLHPNLTTRERVTMQTKPAGCMTCHGIINPLGFTLESFDGVGRQRDRDHDKPVDATGFYKTREGKSVTLRGVRELATFLADSPEAREAFTEQLFHHLVQQPVRAYGARQLDELTQRFSGSGCNIRKLVADVMASTAMTARDIKPVAAK